MSVLLGLDVGTSAIKAVVIDSESGEHLGTSRVSTPWRERNDTVEVEVGALVAAAVAAVASVVAESGVQRIAGIGVTGIAESGALVSATGVPTSPVVAWYDRRGHSEFLALCDRFGADELSRQTGQVVAPRLSAARIRFLHEAGFAGTRWLSVPELIVDGLGGRALPDRSQWSRTGLLDIATASILPEVSEWAGLDPSVNVGAVFSGTPMGEAFGDHPIAAIRGAVLTTAGQDHVAASLGAGVTGSERLCDSWGNGEALVRQTDIPPSVEEALAIECSLSWGLTSSHVLFAGLGTGLLLRAVLDDLAVTSDERAELDALAVGPRPSSTDERAVAWRVALDLAFERVQRAVERIEALSGTVDEVVGCGGWLKSPPIAARKANAVRAFRASPIDEPAATGAALLAGMAAAA